jgi:hypothetical protein
MEQKEDVREVYTKAEASNQRRFAEERALNKRRRSVVERVLNRFILGRRDLNAVRPVLETKTPDAIVKMFERPSEDDCDHKKGGKLRRRYATDYAVTCHTFVDGSSLVKCMICGKKWKRTDPIAIEMMRESTNTPSSSEVSFTPLPEPEDAPEMKMSPLGVVMSHTMRYANFFYRLREAEEILDELNIEGYERDEIEVRIQKYRDGLKKLGEENDSSNRGRTRVDSKLSEMVEQELRS